MFLDVPYGAVLPPSQMVFFNDLLFNFVDDDVNADDHADGDADELAVQASVLRCHCQLSTASWSRLPLRPSGWFEPEGNPPGLLGHCSALEGPQFIRRYMAPLIY